MTRGLSSNNNDSGSQQRKNCNSNCRRDLSDNRGEKKITRLLQTKLGGQNWTDTHNYGLLPILVRRVTALTCEPKS